MTDSIRDLLLPWKDQFRAFRITDDTIASPTSQKLLSAWLDDCILRGVDAIPSNLPCSERKSLVSTAISAWLEEHSFITTWMQSKGIRSDRLLRTLTGRVLQFIGFLSPYKGRSLLFIMVYEPYDCTDEPYHFEDAHKLSMAELKRVFDLNTFGQYTGMWDGLFDIQPGKIVSLTPYRLNILFNQAKAVEGAANVWACVYSCDGRHYSEHETCIKRMFLKGKGHLCHSCR